MRVLTIAAATALVLAACGGAAAPTPAPTTAPTTAPTVAATAAPTPATKLTFTADLKSENEVPPVANEEKTGSGKATVVFDLTRDAAGKITAAKASIDLSLTGFPATAAILIGHIHGPAPAGQNAGVKVPFKTDSDVPLVLTAGASTFKKADVVVDAELAQQIIDKPADFYVNFHSKVNPGGVVRGQLVKG
jgi:CHRD domain-containing protein